jgi:hypothetical protein
VTLADSTIDIRRVAWLPSGNNYAPTPLRQGDIREKQLFNPGYLPASNGVPSQWIGSTDSQPSFNVDRVPPVAGNYEVLTVSAGAASNNTAAANLSVPDDWSWVVKWGALADLLGREGQAKDEARAAYCQRRFEEGIALLRTTPAVLGLQINDAYPLSVDAVRNGDDFNPGWQAAAPGPPVSCYAAGLNLLGFNPPDGNNNYTARVFCVKNAPVPANNNDYLQIARDDYDALLDYAQHLAMFQCGGYEFTQTIPLYKGFLDHAAQYNRKLKEMGLFWGQQAQTSQQEEERRPRMAPE